MSGTITLTAAMRANLLSLQQTGASLSSTQLNLATGNKVNSALDNPVNYFAAQSLNQRASQLSALLDGMGQGIQTIQAANQGITSITSLVNSLTSIVNSAKQDLKNITTQQVLATTGTSGIASTAVADLTTGGTATNDTFTLQNGSSPAVSFTIGAGTDQVGVSLQDVADAINSVQGFSATITYGDGKTQSAGSTEQVGLAYLSVTSTTGQTISAADTTGTALEALGLGTSSAAVTTGGDASDTANYQSVLASLSALSTDSNYQGNNLIGGQGNNLIVQVNELSTTAITVASVDSSAAGIGLTQNTLNSAAEITTATNQIQKALATLQTQASGFANSLSLIQNRQDFTTNLVNTLQDGASSLTIADKNEEGANLLALQTQQQLGIEALSLSSQANQSVLRLFS